MRANNLGYRLPRRLLNPDLRRRVKSTDRPLYMISMDAGFTHQARFSTLLNSDSVIASEKNIASLERIADVVGFPRGEIFLDEPQKAAPNTDLMMVSE